MTRPLTRIAAAVRRRIANRSEQGYVAILTAVLLVPLIGMAAFAVDVGRYYVTARDAQRAADAAALGGVVYLPGDQPNAFSQARELAGVNGFDDREADTAVETGIDKGPTQLKVTVSKEVPSVFGGLFGVSGATISRYAVADYAGPVSMGSPCNAYGNNPDAGATSSRVCSDVGEFWGNVGAPRAPKGNGDAYQNGTCASSDSNCTGGKNTDYDVNGYFYSITLTRPVTNLVIEAFDPALVNVGDLCNEGNLKNAKKLENTVVGDAGSRYAEGQSNPYCTGDKNFAGTSGGFTNQVATSFTLRDPGENPWDPLSFPARSTCAGTGTYPGYTGDLKLALDTTNAEYRKPSGISNAVALASQEGYVAKVFRQWVPLCKIASAAPGTYLLQVKTNGVGSDSGNGHNRFSLRAYSPSDSSAKDTISISGYGKMAAYANLPAADTSFYLARVPSGAGGQVLNVQLFDVGDSTIPGKIRIVAPPRSGVTFRNCVGSGRLSAKMPHCELTGVNSKFNGQWQTISVPIPADYRCDDRDPEDCWVRLQYEYGSGNQPSDTTSWAASIEGDPVRLVE